MKSRLFVKSHIAHCAVIAATAAASALCLPSAGAARADDAPATAAKAKTAWEFNPARDTFRADALLDLRSLNEKTAGETGFVRRSTDGESFVRGDGKPIRFWAVTTYVQRDSPDELAHHARFLAKRGVNMVRLHGHLEPKDKSAPITDVNRKAVDEAWRLVAAMKNEGIYSTLSPYWAASAKPVPPGWGIEGWPENEGPQGLLFFNEQLQKGYRAWLKTLFAEPNPHTGIPLGKDPAVAIIQLQNEDSLLFWTSQNIKGKQLELLGRKFGEFLTKKYGTLEKAKAAWDGASMPTDDFGKGIVGVHIIWEMTQPRTGGVKKRLDDQLEFFARTMHDFNRETARYLREELGCRQLINAGNWKTADPIRLGDVERWSYTANDVTASNDYYSPVHLGPDNGWRINPGDRFVDASALLNPRQIPLNDKQAAGHPHMVTESLWVPPLGYQSEALFLVAAYQSLSGVDGFFWFATGVPEWETKDVAEWNAASRKKWTFATPTLLGQFPGAALLYRKGYVKEAPPAVVEHRPLADLWQRVPPLIVEDAGYDPNRDLGDAPKLSNLTGGIDPLAYLVGPVKAAYGSERAKTKVADLSKYIDRDKKVVRSLTGEVALNWQAGRCIVNAPKAQGVTGFLEHGSTALGDVTIHADNEYASVLVVAMDDKPLKTSGKVLVQLGTLARPTGWETKTATFKGEGNTEYVGQEIVSTGKMPWRIETANVRVTVRNAALKKATVLDINGNAAGAVAVNRAGNALTVTLPPDALYVVLE